MSVTAFNTHAFVKRLTAAGMPEAQAEALADELTPLLGDRLATKDDLANLATKSDLGELRGATKTDLAELRGATKTDLAELRGATKTDLAELRGATKTDLAELRGATKTDLAELKSDLLIWTFGAIGFQTVIVLGAVVALARMSH